jgi:hypothetical protein
MHRYLALFALLLFCAAAPVRAQGPRLATFVTLPLEGVPVRALPEPREGRPDELGMGLGGLMTGLVGIVLGAYAGAAIDRANGCSEWCGLVGGLAGATVGTTVMIPVGVHLSNGQRGSFGRDVAWSALVAAGGWGLALATENGTPLILIPFAQIVAAVASEAGSTPPGAQ